MRLLAGFELPYPFVIEEQPELQGRQYASESPFLSALQEGVLFRRGYHRVFYVVDLAAVPHRRFIAVPFGYDGHRMPRLPEIPGEGVEPECGDAVVGIEVIAND